MTSWNFEIDRHDYVVFSPNPFRCIPELYQVSVPCYANRSFGIWASFGGGKSRWFDGYLGERSARALATDKDRSVKIFGKANSIG